MKRNIFAGYFRVAVLAALNPKKPGKIVILVGYSSIPCAPSCKSMCPTLGRRRSCRNCSLLVSGVGARHYSQALLNFQVLFAEVWPKSQADTNLWGL